MKKLLLSIVSAFLLFALSAQVSENFSDYTVGGKIAAQAQDMGRDYWTTWSNLPGTDEDGVVGEMPSGNKCGKFEWFAPGKVDQILKLGDKTSGKWILTLKMYVPAGKSGYFNVQAATPFGGENNAMQVYVGTDGTNQHNVTPGSGQINADSQGSSGPTFTFTHDAWTNFKVIIDLDNDEAEFYVNNTKIHTWEWTKGTFGDGNCPNAISAMDIFPHVANALFYVDDIDFSVAPTVLYQTNFDVPAAGTYVALSDPDWWTTFHLAPGTDEDAKFSTEQASSAPNSVKLIPDNDLVFLPGDKTSGIYTFDFKMYIPTGKNAYFNVLQIFDGEENSQWAIDVAFNMPAGNPYFAPGSSVFHNYEDFIFQTPPLDTWFPVSIYINLDDDEARLTINGNVVYEWTYSIDDLGSPGPTQLAGVDFWPPFSTSLFYIDDFVYSTLSAGEETFPVIIVTPDKITAALEPEETETVKVTVKNEGTSIGQYYTQPIFDFVPVPGTDAGYLSFMDPDIQEIGGAWCFVTYPVLIEIAAKYTLADYHKLLGTYIKKVSYYIWAPPTDGKITVRIYGGKDNNNPGKILSETIIDVPEEYFDPNYEGDWWLEMELSTPVLLDGQDIWVALEMNQTEDKNYVMTGCDDDDSYNVNGDWFRRNGGKWGTFGEGMNWMIKTSTEGTAIPCWLSFANGETYGSVKKGTEKTFDVKITAPKLGFGTYKANLYVATSDTAHALYTIPCTLQMGHSSFFKVDPTFIKENIQIEIPEEDPEDKADDPLIVTVPVTISNTGDIAGDYEIKAITVDWLKIEGDLSGTLEPEGEDTFDVVLNAEGLEFGTYNTKIEIAVSDVMQDKIEIPCTLIVSLKGAVGENKINTLIFPNPATNRVTIKSSHNIKNVQIINFVGQTVYSTHVNSNVANLDTSNLSSGIYFVRINTNSGSQTVKLTIE